MPRAKRQAGKRSRRDAGRTAYVALLRGVNVGGKNMLPMTQLQAMFIDAGCADARTYIQSGNVVFSGTAALAAKVATAVPAMIMKRLGFRPSMVMRSMAEMERIVASNPFVVSSGGGGDTASLHVAFLADQPTKDHAAMLDPTRSPGDDFAACGSCVYLRLGNGAGKTKLTNAYLDSTLHTISTARNWRTTLTLLQMMRACGE